LKRGNFEDGELNIHAQIRKYVKGGYKSPSEREGTYKKPGGLGGGKGRRIYTRR